MTREPARIKMLFFGVIIIMMLPSIGFLAGESLHPPEVGMNEYSVDIFFEFGEGTDMNFRTEGRGGGLKAIIDDAVNSEDMTAVYRDDKIYALNGIYSGDFREWFIFEWRPPTGWKYTELGESADSRLKDGNSYAICFSEMVVNETGERIPRLPDALPDPVTISFTVLLTDEFNATEELSRISISQQMGGFTISGTGRTVSESFVDACAKEGFSLKVSGKDGKGPEGWIESFLGLDGSLFTEDMTWTQYRWEKEKGEWVPCNLTLGYYDPRVVDKYLIVRQPGSNWNTLPNINEEFQKFYQLS